MNLHEALSTLPHGPGFRFLDQLSKLEPGKFGEGSYTVPNDESFLRGHFPGDPMFPGVLLLEAGAQLAGVVAQTDPQITPLRGLKLTAVRGAKILGTARPGETIAVEASISARLGNLIQARVKVRGLSGTLLEADVALSGAPASPCKQPHIP